MSFTVEKNIPIPAIHRSGGRTAKYPYAQMTAGDSFFVPEAECPPKTVQQSAAAYGRRHKIVFESRRMDGGIRVWRR